MTLSAKSWLPDGALDDGVLCDRVQAVAAEWATRWIPLPKLHTDQAQDGEQPVLKAGDDTHFSSDGRLRLSASLACRLHLGMAMLGVAVDRNQVASKDQALLEQLAGEALDDLAAILASDLAGSQPRAASVGSGDGRLQDDHSVCFRIVLAEAGPAIDLALADELAIAARKNEAQPSRAPKPANWRAAVGTTPVRVGARVGDVSLSLSEISSLEIGDLLVLDRPVDDGVELTVNNEVLPDSSCQIEQDGARVGLRFNV